MQTKILASPVVSTNLLLTASVSNGRCTLEKLEKSDNDSAWLTAAIEDLLYRHENNEHRQPTEVMTSGFI